MVLGVWLCTVASASAQNNVTSTNELLASPERISQAIPEFVLNGAEIDKLLPTLVLRLPNDQRVLVSRLQSTDGNWEAARAATRALGSDLNTLQRLRLQRILRQIAEEADGIRGDNTVFLQEIVKAERVLARSLTAEETYAAITPRENILLINAQGVSNSAELNVKSTIRKAEKLAQNGNEIDAVFFFYEAWNSREHLPKDEAAALGLKLAALLIKQGRIAQADSVLKNVNANDLSPFQLSLYDAVQLATVKRTTPATSVRQVPQEPSQAEELVAENVESQTVRYFAGTTVRALSGVNTTTVQDASLGTNVRGEDVRFDVYFAAEAKLAEVGDGALFGGIRLDTYQYIQNSHLSNSQLKAYVDWNNSDPDTPISVHFELFGNFDQHQALSAHGVKLGASTRRKVDEQRSYGVSTSATFTDFANGNASDGVKLSINPWYRWLDVSGSGWNVNLSGAFGANLANQQSNSNVSVSAHVRADRKVRDDLVFFASTGFEQLNYLGNDTLETTKTGHQTAVSLSFGLDYNINDNLSADVSVEGRKQTSNIARRDFTSLNVGFGLRGNF